METKSSLNFIPPQKQRLQNINLHGVTEGDKPHMQPALLFSQPPNKNCEGHLWTVTSPSPPRGRKGRATRASWQYAPNKSAGMPGANKPTWREGFDLEGSVHICRHIKANLTFGGAAKAPVGPNRRATDSMFCATGPPQSTQNINMRGARSNTTSTRNCYAFP